MNILRSLIILATAAVAAGCAEKPADDQTGKTETEGKVTLTSDCTFICADGTDAATFTVTVTGDDGKVTDVTSEAEIYFNKTDELLEGNTFSTSTKGEYSFYAAYGLGISETVGISALTKVPQLPADTQENSTTFRHRMLLIQHTGATCPNCPLMMTSLKNLSENEEYRDAYNLVASHSYYDGLNDDAYSPAAKTLSATFGSGSYPELTFNLTNTNTGHDYSEICSQVAALTQDSAHAGIAMAVETADNEIIARVEFKSGEDRNYRIGAWLLEDDIFARQSGAGEAWQHYHNNAIRAMYGEKQTESIYGAAAGKIQPREKIEKLFRFPLEDSWKAENCKVIAFVTKEDSEGNFDIANCVVCKVGETTGYEYK